ncbi:MAG TPA: aspartate--tRNA(Asn) ligase [Candidatus Paceibacterota bacterium]
MERTYIKDLTSKVGQEVSISGWVSVRRDQGKLIFFDFRDMTGYVQGVILPNAKEAHAVGTKLRAEWVVTVKGKVNARPERNVQKDKQNGAIELEILSIDILSEAKETPFELGTEVNLDTNLDYLPYTLRSDKSRALFKMQSVILEAYRASLRARGFTEFMSPALVGGDAEGGAAVFKVEYFNDKNAYLATSPQFYKQIMVGAQERAFTIAKVFRAEKSATTRHLSEIVQMDFEMGFINNEFEVMKELETTIKDVVREASKHEDIFKKFGTTAPLTPEKFPIFTLKEAQDLVAKEYNRTIEDTNDMAPEDERQICEYAKKNLGSDFVFITKFPTKKRAFYTYEEPSEAPQSRGFDLLFRGLEINSGAQRIHSYDSLVERIKERGMDPEKFSFYLQAFKYGMPPHGGCSTGLERFTARMLEIANVKEATAFPRDINRIDNRLTKEE